MTGYNKGVTFHSSHVNILVDVDRRGVHRITECLTGERDVKVTCIYVTQDLSHSCLTVCQTTGIE